MANMEKFPKNYEYAVQIQAINVTSICQDLISLVPEGAYYAGMKPT
jgi:hypothetical protein